MSVEGRFSIPYQGLSNGDHHFDFQVDASLFEGREGVEIKDGKGVVSIDARKGVGGVSLDISFDGEVTVPCDRCLEDCPLEVSFNEKALLRETPEEHESDEGIIYLPAGAQTADLADYIYESLVLALPYQRVHPDDENGNPTCDPDMLGRFKIVSEEEFGQLTGQE